MTDKHKNPPAFPCIDNCGPNGQTVWRHDGMTLLDYFAGNILQGLLAAEMELSATPSTLKNLVNDLVGLSYVIAQAMLKEREKYDH